MRSSGNGPFGVLLLAAPLVAVPLLAIFGIPQFAPGVDAGSLSEHAETGFEDEAGFSRPSKNRRRSSIEDLFDPLEENGSIGDDFASEEETLDNWEPPAEALQGYRMAPPEEQFADASSSEEWFERSQELENQGDDLDELDQDEFDRGKSRQGLEESYRAKEEVDYDRPRNNRRGSNRDLEDVNPPKELAFENDEIIPAKYESEAGARRRKGNRDSVVVEEFSWRQASRRLRELGDNVKHYFDYDIERETYVFHCELSPHDDPGVVQEFQAQGHEPLTTVREVIKQVERWSKNRQSNLARSEQRSSDRSQ